MMIGRRFGRLIVLKREEDRVYSSGYRALRWSCKCDCGTIKIIFSKNLYRGQSKSCGCLSRERGREANTTHGHARPPSPTYTTWAMMKQRCTNLKSKDWPRYGGRGITICEKWLKFENFLADMGERPEGLTLDRINNDGNYNSDNCRWATPKEQANNR